MLGVLAVAIVTRQLIELQQIDGRHRVARRLGAIDARVTLAVDSPATVEAAAAGGVREALIDVNVGLPRCGCPPEEAGRIAELARASGLELRGVMGYEGHLQMVDDRPKRETATGEAMQKLAAAVELTDQMISRFGDPDAGAFFFTASDAGDILGIAKQKVPDIVIIDPLTLYAATEQGFDPNRATQVRKMLTPLVRVARKLNAVFLVNRHYGKTPKSAMHRGIGSIDYAATARSMIGVNKDPEDPECTRIVSHIKSNLAPKMRESLTFLLDKNLNPPFQWSGTCDVDPDHLTDSEASSAARDEKSKRTEAMDFLRQILSEGPVPVTVCREQAKELGISESTLRRAREKLGVVSEQSGFAGDKNWTWYLP